ncbi:YebC/PmpR family DNA-binding transcriptional regulator [Fervidobacterium pennivorans subsp. shakshaketiis]|jgi:YebC/PmpR family DNA-binding regulatory protein|uniref:Probable transcriptional regulatory protein Ferpe_1384 n=1 Tax=Fervidobacterium pennivorans (strain DSM 9078 / Ven5) TaxID=771875 RepID=H9UD65_FERPD|nr:YebC/PmpR family DNA-binding transcriptional regulator [Fervidobacterium pennivorans]AFG35458.1 DNA-binding regulatory protein, YebC/PmpR family [Fervidobacterium pennivorans DSM 9078]QIV78903.1 YebC/PmpR family DNA-binding transcriptional regulator [Fervidobacterium pennivorans subsp. keratinolyticus]
MSGHNKWANIKHRKAAQDAKRSKIFTKIIREIIVAAREGGGNPETNPRLRAVLEKAKEANMPKDTIERSIKKGTGELEGERYEEVIYEAYAPGGVALYILALTDNKNRTAQELRHILSKNGGSLAESGSVAWIFERKGVVEIPREKIADMDEFTLLAIDAGAEDIEEGDPVLVYTSPENLTTLRENLAKNGFEGSAKITYKPKNYVKVSGSDAEKVLKLVDALEDNDDVQEVFGNFDIDDAELEAIMAKLEG